MKYKTQNYPAINLVGISVHTSYKDSMQDIPKLWEEFNKEGLSNSILGKESEDVYAVYYDYESDFKGSYHFFIGYIVDKNNNVEAPLQRLEIPEQRYSVFPVRGDFPKCLIDTWESIWESNIDRKYTFDFEKYAENSNLDDSNPELDVFISIK